MFKTSVRPTISLMVRKPRPAIISRTSSAKKVKKFTMCSGSPVKCLRNSGSCVATPTGHVFKWHFRIIIQPSEINAAVAKPNSSAPSKAPTTTSRPVRKPPSTCTEIRPRNSFITKVCCVSAKPISHGPPAFNKDVIGLAPVPPS